MRSIQFFSHIFIQLTTCSLLAIIKRKTTWVLITLWRTSISSIVNGKSAVKRMINKCVVCHFWKVNAGRQQMGDLPCHRMEKRRSFEVVGTDLMGPVAVPIGRFRVKRYICIFNCLATRAVHLEVIPLLDANVFLQAFQRFCSCQNVSPTNVYSNNGTNFVVAAKGLKKKTRHFNSSRASRQEGF